MLRKVFGPMKDKVTGEGRRLNNEELYDLYSSPNIFREIKPTRIKWAEHVGQKRCEQDFGGKI